MIVLEYQSSEMQLREIGLTHQRLDLKISHRRTMSGDLRTWKRTNATYTHIFRIAVLEWSNYRSLMTFLAAAMGNVIKLTLPDTETVKYVRMTNEAAVTQSTRYSREIPLELEEV